MNDMQTAEGQIQVGVMAAGSDAIRPILNTEDELNTKRKIGYSEIMDQQKKDRP